MKSPKRFLLCLLFLCLSLQKSLAFAQPRSPQDVVKLFMQVYGTERMREILPYTLPEFRDGLEPEVWLERDYRAMKALGYAHLDGVIKDVTIKGREATVVVASRIKTIIGTVRQTETYRLLDTEQGWKLLDLRTEEELIEAPPLWG
ncbi:MAG: hypothetical protein ACE1Z6_01985 [Candidatus Methylomirabilales bacterium]